MTTIPLETANRLLAGLSPEDLALLAPDLSSVALPLRTMLEPANKPIEHCYFIEAGIASVVARSANHRLIEAGLIGREGMAGLLIVLGDDRSPNETFMQAAGHARRIHADHLRAAMAASETLRARLLRYAQAFLVQTTHTALANGAAKIGERLARWLLMSQDRIGSSELPLTHEFLSVMLGVRRPGVTDAVHQLEGKGLIRGARGMISVIDRDGLKHIADGFYGVPEAEYERLLG